MQVTLTLNRRGSVALPPELLQALGLKSNDQLMAEITPDGLLLRPASMPPVEIYTDERIREFEQGEAELAALFARLGAKR